MRQPRQSLSIIFPVVIACGVSVLGSGQAAAAACSDLDSVVASFVGRGAEVYMIPAERLQVVTRDAEALTGDHYTGVTRGFLVRAGQGFLLGFEVGGCLLDPIQLGIRPQLSADIGSA